MNNKALIITLMFVAAAALMIYFMPRDNRNRYAYEENRPWSYSLLTAPFDITVYRDSATVKRMTDSVDRAFIPVFRRDEAVQARILGAIEASHNLSRQTKAQLSRTVTELYDQGIVSFEIGAAIARGDLPEVKFNENNVSRSRPTEQFRSRRDAYALLDSLFHDSPERPVIQSLGLSSLLLPNIVRDDRASDQYRETLLQPIVSGIGVVQQGEKIIDRGDIVTPQIYQVLKTYEATLDRKALDSSSEQLYTLLGQLLYVAVVMCLLVFYFHLYYPDQLSNAKAMAALMVLMVGFFIFAVALGKSFVSGLYIEPLAILAIVVLVFFDARTAFFVYTMEVLLCSVLSAFTLEYIFIEITAGAAVVFSLKELSKRSHLLRSALIAFVAYSLGYVAVELMSAGNFSALSGKLFGYFAINAVLISFAYILIFIFEKVFGMISVVTLVELADINNPLLSELSTECPGTFQHSLSVSNLASEAAKRIGANVQLVRAGALYHDVGKIDNPAFFTENQHGVNPHDLITPLQSARIITGHIPDGLRRADHAKLPQVIKDLIAQHHGRGTARYFLTMEQRAHPDQEVDPEPFTYPGPDPQTREASLLMMADTVEAASRSLTDHSEEAISALVNRLIDAQVAEGRHSQSPLSFRDIATIKQTFISRLRTMFHARISYPDK